MCLCCAGDSYEMVKENETIEALHERAKIIVDMELLCACTRSCLSVLVSRGPDLGNVASCCVPDPRGFWCMAPHEYGQYLHILTRAGSDDSHDGPQPWEGITGRVKQETNKLLDVIKRSDTAMQSRVDTTKDTLLGVIERSNTTNKEAIMGVEAKLEAQETKLEAQLGDVQSKLDSQQSKLECIEALLTSLVAEKQ